MPTDACQFFYECAGCKRILRPKTGECCVFCSYGSVPVRRCRSNAAAHAASEPPPARRLIVNEPRFQDITERTSYLRGISERLAPTDGPVRVRRIERLHRALGNLERELEHSFSRSRFGVYQTRIAEIESAVRSLKVARPFEVDLHRLKVHLRMVQEEASRLGVS